MIPRGEDLPGHDFYCQLMSLPLAFKTSLASIPKDVPYVSAERALVNSWKARLAHHHGLRVGLAWAGNPRSHDYQLSRVDQRRSVPLSTFSPFLETRGVHFFNVQKEPADSNDARWKSRVREFPADLKDFENTAALIENLDLVISVDTSLAHLAGAMGKPVWLLSRLDGCWRWLLNREDSPWYPTMKIFRQEMRGDWCDPINRIAADLVHFVNASPSGPR